MAIVNVKTIPSIAFMVITGYTITNASFKAVDLETLPDRDILSLNYAINNQQLIGQSGSDKTAINAAAAQTNLFGASGTVSTLAARPAASTSPGAEIYVTESRCYFRSNGLNWAQTSIGSFTWTEVQGLTVSDFSDVKIFCPDVGIHGSVLITNGTRFVPELGIINHGALSMFVGKAPTINANASPTANGGTTFATAVGVTVASGYWYVPANSIVASHSAGFYYGEMSSTTDITFFNNTYVPSAGVSPEVPAVKTPFSGAVPGATGVTTAVIAWISKSIPGGLLGAYGAVRPDVTVEGNSSGNSKNFTFLYESTLVRAYALTTSPYSQAEAIICNNGASNTQRTYNAVNSTTTSVPTTSAHDTSVDFSFFLELKTPISGGDWNAMSRLNLNLEVPK